MSDLVLSLDQLSTLADDLEAIQHELENAEGNGDAAAEATGDDELRERMNDFHSKWDAKRGDMLKNVQQLAGMIRNVADTFQQVDNDLANALEEKA